MRLQIRAATAVLSLVPLGGCCTMAQGLSALFCGPRKPLPVRSYLTPERSLDTLLAAIACDDTDTMWRSIGPDMKNRLHLGRVEFEVWWQKVKDETPGIHLADQAQRSAPRAAPADDTDDQQPVAFTLTLPGARLEVVFRRHTFYRVDFMLAGTDQPEEGSWFLERKGAHLRTQYAADSTPFVIQLPGLPFQGVQESEVLSATLGTEWLVQDFRVTSG